MTIDDSVWQYMTKSSPGLIVAMMTMAMMTMTMMTMAMIMAIVDLG